MPIAASRSFVGDFFEELTLSAFPGAVRLRTDARADICPDVRVSNGSYLEVKSVGVSGDTLVYVNRLNKDWRFAGSNELAYIFWRHTFRMRAGMLLSELRDDLAASVVSCTLVEFSALAKLYRATPLMQFSSKSTRRGYGSHGYTHGYRARLSVINNLCPHQSTLRDLTAYGRAVSNTSIFASTPDLLRAVD